MINKVKKSMKDNLILSGSEAESAIDFVIELLELSIEKTKVEEPYATRSIAEMQKSVSNVMDLKDLIEEIE